jgi:hypothetical protein
VKVYINEAYVKRRATVSRWASLLGIAVLAGGFLVSLRRPDLFLVSLGSLLLGFLLSNVGIYYANRYMHRNRPDTVLAQALKGIDNRYALYQFLLPASQVLREPGGLTVFVLKPQEGLVSLEKGQWRNRQGWSRLLRWIGQEGLGKPDQEAEREAQRLQDWLKTQAPDLDVPVRGVVVFTHPRVELDLDAPPLPALLAKQLKGWLRKAGKLAPFPKETQARLTQLLDQAARVDYDQD